LSEKHWLTTEDTEETSNQQSTRRVRVILIFVPRMFVVPTWLAPKPPRSHHEPRRSSLMCWVAFSVSSVVV